MSLTSDHAVLIVPGLIDKLRWHERLTGKWHKYGLTPVVFRLNWLGKEKDNFQPMLTKLLQKIDILHHEYKKVSLIGSSAGGSAVFNAFIERKNIVYRAINICGNLRFGNRKIQLLHLACHKSPAYRQSVELFSRKEPGITDEDKKRLMTICARFGDEFIPRKYVKLHGATNLVIPAFGHMLTISIALSVLLKQIVIFLKKSD